MTSCPGNGSRSIATAFSHSTCILLAQDILVSLDGIKFDWRPWWRWAQTLLSWNIESI